MKKTLILFTAIVIGCLNTTAIAQKTTDAHNKTTFFGRLFGNPAPTSQPASANTQVPASNATVSSGKPIRGALGKPIGAPVAQSQKKTNVFKRLFGKQKSIARPHSIDQVIDNNTAQTVPSTTTQQPAAKTPNFFDKFFRKKKTSAQKPKTKKLPFRPIQATITKPEPASQPAKLAVIVGNVSCAGKVVAIVPKNDTYVLTVPTSKKRSRTYVMRRVYSAIGAVKLQNTEGNAYWLQLANKSMLLDTKAGGRLADNCRNADQQRVEEELKRKPAKLF